MEARVERRGSLAHGDAMKVIARSRALVLSSASEACPMVVLEAMALGRPVVAPDVGGVRDLVVDGETGLLFPSTSTTALAGHLASLSASPERADELGASGANRAKERFDLSAIVDRYRAVYRAAIESRQ
jgi:glycosyltransferase involved in cell wall biosynthesis